MTAAVWSTPPDKCSLDFPARTLVRESYETLEALIHNRKDPIHAQPPSSAAHRQAVLANYQGRQVRRSNRLGV